MDAATLLHMLEQALAQNALGLADRRFVESCLASLKSTIIGQAEYVELERIARSLTLPGTQSGGVNASSATFGDNAILAAGDVNQGTATINDGAVGVAVGVNIGHIIYGADLNEQRREQLVRYLQRLANAKAVLQLRGLAANLANGLNLPAVYVLLAVEKSYQVLYQLTPKESPSYGEPKFPIPKESSSDQLLPDQAILDYDTDISGVISALRATLVSESVLTNQHLVLCGAPGSGKSTFLHHLAWVLAMRGMDMITEQTRMPGWNDNGQRRLLPVMLSLRTLAGAIRRDGSSAATVSAALRHEMTTTYDLQQPRELLDHALSQSGKALLLFDGLDEVPLEATEMSADRATTLAVVRDFARLHSGARVVITCRMRAWTDAFARELQWPVATIAPLTGGQIRHFVQALYPQLVTKGVITTDQVTQYGASLIAAIFDPDRPRLREMAANPLMLTMMALVRTRGELPRDRPALYEQILGQLLDQWDVQRAGQSLSQVIGDERVGSDQIRPVLDRLSYEAHRDATSGDGRGRIGKDSLQVALTKHFTTINVPDPWNAAERCIAYFDQRSGLLQPEDDGSMYAFAHLTLQEHCAGRHLLLHEGVTRVMELRGDDRWREPLTLGVGVLMQESLGAGRVEQVLNALTSPCERSGASKPRARWYRDLVLAAELGADRDWDLLRATIDVPRLHTDLRAGLVRLLEDRENNLQAEQMLLGTTPAGEHPPLTVHERIHAADLLAQIGDPRFPVSSEQWRAESLTPTFTAAGTHYWRYVPAGTYRIGGWKEGQEYADHTLPAFWIARYPTTMAQYQAFMQAGGYDHEKWWTPQGWRWRTEQDRKQPDWWAAQTTQESLNQPVYGVTWYEARAFCGWLDQVLTHQGYIVRLPSEAEWEAAAVPERGDGRTLFPWGYAEKNQERAIYNERVMNARPAPVATCSLGVAACGALDLIGNIWECTQSSWEQYPAASDVLIDDRAPGISFYEETVIPLRGISYRIDSVHGACAARNWERVDYLSSDDQGFRCIVAPRSR